MSLIEEAHSYTHCKRKLHQRFFGDITDVEAWRVAFSVRISGVNVSTDFLGDAEPSLSLEVASLGSTKLLGHSL
jgi:hypothetical protein